MQEASRRGEGDRLPMSGMGGDADDIPGVWLESSLAGVTDIVMLVNAEGRVVFLNPAGELFLGVSRELVGGRALEEIIEFVDADSSVSVDFPWMEVLREARPVELIHGVAAGFPGRRARCVEARAYPVQTRAGDLLGGVLVLRDCEDEQQRETAVREAYVEADRRAAKRRQAYEVTANALQENSISLESFAASTPELIFAKDCAGRILMVNPAAIKALGMPREEVIGRNDLVLFGNPGDRERIRESDRRVTDRGESITVEQKQASKSGVRTYLVTKSPLRGERGNIVGLMGVAIDITERNRAQRELEHLLLAEHRLRGEAERASRAKDEFLAMVSHELRSPLNALKGWSHVLSSAHAPDAFLVTRATQAIKRNVEHQARLIDDLLDTSRIISGKLEIERQPVNLLEVVHAAIELSRHNAMAKQISLQLSFDEASLMTVGDSGRLQQVVINLLSNAIKFTPEGGKVDITVRSRGRRVELVVSDSGIGIDPDFLPHVFNRFSQADSSTVRRYSGLGIGLALVRYLIELHGGTVSAASPGVGHGATFTVELPLMQLEPAGPRENGESPSPKQDALRGVRVFLVDDDPDARDVVQIALNHAGALVHAFSSGDDFLLALREGGPHAMPTVMLLDIAMPDEDGFGVLKRVRELSDIPFLPAIAVTALTYVDRQQFVAAGFQESIGKPVDIDRLIDAIMVCSGRKDAGPRSELICLS